MLHEQTHINRKDHIIKLLAYTALAIHWFNPLAWVAFVMMEKDMEMSCDERVLRHMGGRIKKDYSLTLLSLATNRRPLITSPLAFGESGTKERVKNVLRYKKHSKIFAAFAIVMVLVLSIGLAMNRAVAEPEAYVPYESHVHEENDGTVPFQEFAKWQYIQGVSAEIAAIPYVVIAETRIDSFEYLATFDHILDYPVEMWHLAFSLRIEPDERTRWGTFEPIDGWLSSPYSGFNDLTTTLIMPATGILGASGHIRAIPWWLSGGHTTWELEVSLRAFLEHEGLIPPISFPGSHYLMYFEFGSYDFMQNRLLLSRPFGPNSIWVVERWMQLSGDLHHNRIPQSDTLSMQEFFEYQQAQFEAGNANWLADPDAVARAYMELHGWGDVMFTSMRYVTDATPYFSRRHDGVHVLLPDAVDDDPPVESVIIRTPVEDRQPPALFIAFDEFVANARGETKAMLVSVDGGGTVGILVVELYGVPTATLIYEHNLIVRHADLGSQDAGFVTSVSADRQLVNLTDDGGRRSYTIFTISAGGNLVPRMTILAENTGALGDEQASSYYLIHGFAEELPREGWTSIDYDAFQDIRVRNGLDNIQCIWTEVGDQRERLLEVIAHYNMLSGR